MRLAYVGNFTRDYTTETHVADALDTTGATVLRLQEDDETVWPWLAGLAAEAAIDAVLWTRTWHLPHAGEFLDRARAAGVPVVGFHLDRWWGLDREVQVRDDPYFQHLDLLVTADGGHDAEWEQAGIRHVWMPPGVSAADAALPPDTSGLFVGGRDVVFCGSWHYPHAEWEPMRTEMLRQVRLTYGRRLVLVPNRRTGPIRGARLNGLYASVPIVVGDSCLAGGATRYWSDRIPETLGRGGFLIHPYVPGIEDHYTDGEHLAMYEPGDWPTLLGLIDRYLNDVDGRERIRAAGRAHVLATATYERRAADLVALIEKETR